MNITLTEEERRDLRHLVICTLHGTSPNLTYLRLEALLKATRLDEEPVAMAAGLEIEDEDEDEDEEELFYTIAPSRSFHVLFSRWFWERDARIVPPPTATDIAIRNLIDRVEALEDRLDSLEQHLGRLDHRIGPPRSRSVDEELTGNHKRLEALEDRLNTLNGPAWEEKIDQWYAARTAQMVDGLSGSMKRAEERIIATEQPARLLNSKEPAAPDEG